MKGRTTMLMVPLFAALALTTATAQEPPADGTGEETPASDSTGEDSTAAAEIAPAAEPSADEEQAASEFTRELRTVEEEVNQLKERVFRSKATLQLLKELVIEGASMGSRVVLWHINKMGAAYTMEEARYFLDGKSVYTKVDPSGGLNGLREVKVHEQAVPPGQHNLQVNMVLRGNGFGVFSYLKTYAFKVQSSYSFKVEDGNACIVRVIANERTGVGRSFVDRPSVRYEERCETLRNE